MLLILSILLELERQPPVPEAALSLGARFCAIYVTQPPYGLLEGENRRAMAPLLSGRLLRSLDQRSACQQDWFRQQPEGSTNKPPFVDCCLFSGVPDGMPTSCSVVSAERLPDGRYRLTLEYATRYGPVSDLWHGALSLIRQGVGYAIDDVAPYLGDESPGRSPWLSESVYHCCQAGRWRCP